MFSGHRIEDSSVSGVLFLYCTLRFQLSDQDEIGGSAGQRGGSSDAGRIRNTDQESFPHFHLILRLRLDLLGCPRVRLVHLLCPFEKENRTNTIVLSKGQYRCKAYPMLMLMLIELIFRDNHWISGCTLLIFTFL